MEIAGKNICFACAYAAEYGGGFIKMLCALAERLRKEYTCRIFYIFPEQESKIWMQDLAEGTIAFTRQPYLQCQNEIAEFIREWNLDLIHSHFEAYDVAVAKAVRQTGKDVKMVWHVHDYLSLDKTGLSFPSIRKFFSNQRFWNQYGKWGKNAYFIGVSAEVTSFVSHYRNHRFSYPASRSVEELQDARFSRAQVLLNGIDMSRLEPQGQKTEGQEFTFLSFGGEAYSKGIATIMQAAERLHKENVKFRVLVTRGYSVDAFFARYFHGHLPSWLEVIEQNERVAELFAQADCYISASHKETMSMAIAEASIYGLPVIQSDIPGTMWNSRNPSTYIFKVKDACDLAEKMKMVMQLDSGMMAEQCQISAKNNRRLLDIGRWVSGVVNVYHIA